uniref:Uncharacterized protein n=1 Tax=Catharus ustulatus TaxID=91951 RepID=A0A8C3XY93_CATUS
MQSGTIDGKRWACCPEKGWRAAIFISFAQQDKGPWRDKGQMQGFQSCLPFPGQSPLRVSQLVFHLSSHCASEMWGQS